MRDIADRKKKLEGEMGLTDGQFIPDKLHAQSLLQKARLDKRDVRNLRLAASMTKEGMATAFVKDKLQTVYYGVHEDGGRRGGGGRGGKRGQDGRLNAAWAAHNHRGNDSDSGSPGSDGDSGDSSGGGEDEEFSSEKEEGEGDGGEAYHAHGGEGSGGEQSQNSVSTEELEGISWPQFEAYVQYQTAKEAFASSRGHLTAKQRVAEVRKGRGATGGSKERKGARQGGTQKRRSSSQGRDSFRTGSIGGAEHGAVPGVVGAEGIRAALDGARSAGEKGTGRTSTRRNQTVCRTTPASTEVLPGLGARRRSRSDRGAPLLGNPGGPTSRKRCWARSPFSPA